MPKYYTVQEVGALLRRHPRTLYRWLHEGFIRGKKVRDGWLIPEEELNRIILEKWDVPKNV